MRLRLALLALAATGCTEVTGPGRELLDARQRWAQRGPSSYTYTVTRGCFCLDSAVGPVDVAVRDGVVESRRYTRGGVAVSAQFATSFPTVDGLFAYLDSARARNPASLVVEYDPALGYPTRIDVDFVQQMADDEMHWRAGGLRAR